MSDTFFSVVIPTYNALSYLKRSLDSVLSQSFDNYDVLVIDNSSTDGTKDYLNSIQDNRISWYQVNNNGVIGYSRNIGIKEAKGDWVAFLDADDEWQQNKLEVIYSVLTEHKNVDIIVHAEKVILEGEVIGFNNYGVIKEPVYESLLLGGNQLSPSSTVVRTTLLRNVGGFSEDSKYITAEDYELWLRLAKCNSKFYYHDEPLGIYYRFKGTASSNLKVHMSSGNRVFYDHLLSWGNENNIPLKVVDQLYLCRLLLSYGSSMNSSIKSLNLVGIVVSARDFIIVFLKGILNGNSMLCFFKGNFALYKKILTK